LAALLGVPPLAAAADPVVLDNFDGGEGRFNSTNPGTASGTNRNLSAATADQTTSTAQQGAGSEQVGITPLNPGTSSDFPTDTFRLRFLSGGGTPANNVNIGPTGYVGYFLKTTTPGLTTAIGLDDNNGTTTPLEQSVFRPVTSDGEWHLYQFRLDDPDQWEPFALTGMNGQIDGPTVTIDSIFIQGPVSSSAPVTLFLDTVAYNTAGDLSSLVVPEPGTAGLLAAAGLLATARRRRRQDRAPQ
jgi:hypothetical protein